MERWPRLLYTEVIDTTHILIFSRAPNCLALLSSVSHELIIHFYSMPLEVKPMFGVATMQGLTKQNKTESKVNLSFDYQDFCHLKRKLFLCCS